MDPISAWVQVSGGVFPRKCPQIHRVTLTGCGLGSNASRYFVPRVSGLLDEEGVENDGVA